MITWIKIWPLMLVPLFIIVLIGLMPTFEFAGVGFGGGFIRQWVLNNFVFYLLPTSNFNLLVVWFMEANYLGEVVFYLLVSINLYLLVYPFFYGAGQLIIKVSAWMASTDLKQKQSSLN